MKMIDARCLIAACLLVLGGCASTAGSEPEKDPLEPLNRAIYEFNDVVDRATLKPVAKGYKKVVPNILRKGVSNFFDNLLTPRSALNNVLQGKPGRGGQDLFRFVVNSTMGVGGLVDVASSAGMEQYDETFAQTFAVWGIPDGPYVYLPFLGPHTLSDVVARPFDIAADPLQYHERSTTRDKLRVLRIIDIRTNLLSAEQFIDDSKDPYIAVREAYLQNREYRVYDGNPPASQEEQDLFDEFLDEE